MKIKSMKKGEYFTLDPIDRPTKSQVWIRGHYDRSLRAYWCRRFDDMSEIRFLSGSREVFVCFTFKEVQGVRHD